MFPSLVFGITDFLDICLQKNKKLLAREEILMMKDDILHSRSVPRYPDCAVMQTCALLKHCRGHVTLEKLQQCSPR